MFGCIGYAEIAFSILPGGVSEDVSHVAENSFNVPSIADYRKKSVVTIYT